MTVNPRRGSQDKKPLKSLDLTASGVDHVSYCVLDIETAGSIMQPPDTYELLFVGILLEQRHTIFKSNIRDLRLFADFIMDFKGVVITFNGNDFDLPILRHTLQLADGRTLDIPMHYDLLLSVGLQLGRRVSLDSLARENLGVGKSCWNHDRNQEIWDSNPDLLIAHNKEDLCLTAGLFELVLQNQQLKVNGRSVFLPFATSEPFGAV